MYVCVYIRVLTLINFFHGSNSLRLSHRKGYSPCLFFTYGYMFLFLISGNKEFERHIVEGVFIKNLKKKELVRDLTLFIS